MSYLIFGIVVMLVTWWITRDYCKIQLKELADKKLQLDQMFAMNDRLLDKICKYSDQICELKSELITQKAMEENK